MKSSLWVSMLLCFSIMPVRALTQDTFYIVHAVGWNWYHIEPIAVDKKADPVSSSAVIQTMNATREAIKVALYQAILYPTEANITHYMQVQHQLLWQVNDFERVWKQVLLHHPELDYSLLHPVNQIGVAIYQDKRRVEEDALITRLGKRYGLFFFYRSTCPYCQRFSPILKQWSEAHHIPVLPITLDGIALPDFPNSHRDQGQAEAFHVSREPALFTVNPHTHQAIPVSYGLLSESELRERMLAIATQLK
ncbi:MAG: type-F conjugative transfer system pilin assembly protein TraF [Gammaproteobacteria bacterium RIFCSPHIGHO2_12_FULL_45_9]|nr:MAG: type-F conjugative transfer system pilin assembly protein TraF [Gammaproteobacteria bacterium RIFCSPHIGHO2_12_FULL_45_9]